MFSLVLFQTINSKCVWVLLKVNRVKNEYRRNRKRFISKKFYFIIIRVSPVPTVSPSSMKIS